MAASRLHIDPTLADRSLSEELECAVCMELPQHPSTLQCGHTFCGGCISSLHSEDGKIRCPTCRKRQRIDQTSVPENKSYAHLCELARKAQEHACPEHNGKIMSYYCRDCDVRCCDACAILGSHRGHAMEDLATASEQTCASLREHTSQVSASHDAMRQQGKRDEEAFRGLMARVDEMADEAVDAIEKLRNRSKADLKVEHARCKQAVDDVLTHANTINARIDSDLSQLPHRDGFNALVADTARNVETIASTAPKGASNRALDFLHGMTSFKELQSTAQLLRASSVADPLMQVFMQSAKSEQFPQTLEIRRSWTLEKLKTAFLQACERKLGPTNGKPELSLCFYREGKALDPDATLGEQGIERGCVLDVRLRVHKSPPALYSAAPFSRAGYANWIKVASTQSGLPTSEVLDLVSTFPTLCSEVDSLVNCNERDLIRDVFVHAQRCRSVKTSVNEAVQHFEKTVMAALDGVRAQRRDQLRGDDLHAPPDGAAVVAGMVERAPQRARRVPFRQRARARRQVRDEEG